MTSQSGPFKGHWKKKTMAKYSNPWQFSRKLNFDLVNWCAVFSLQIVQEGGTRLSRIDGTDSKHNVPNTILLYLWCKISNIL